MAKSREKKLALKLRNQGHSYSYIKEKVGVSKGTLSVWLREYPLSDEQLRALRDHNPKRIERFRATMAKKRQEKLDDAYARVKQSLRTISERELYVAGFYLYWAEGLKTGSAEVSLANTDPAMIKLFIKWLELLGIHKGKMRVRLHLYSDMDVEEKTRFWSHELGLPEKQFSRPYIKRAKHDDYSRKGRFGHGTCNLRYFSKDMQNFVLMGLKYLREQANVDTI